MRLSLGPVALVAIYGMASCGDRGGASSRKDAAVGPRDATPESMAPPHGLWSAGTSVYRRNTMLLLSERGTTPIMFATQVFGLAGVEVFADVQGTSTPTVLAPPASLLTASGAPPPPVALAQGDFDIDGHPDLMVATLAGHWFAPGKSDLSYGPGLTNDLTASLDAVGAASECLHAAQQGGSSALLWACDGGQDFPTVQRTEGSGWSGPTINALPPWQFHDIALASDRAFFWPARGATPPSLVYLSSVDLRLVRYIWGADGFSVAGPLSQAPLSPPYVRPFDSFDHVAPLDLDGCPLGAVGVGVFNVDVKGAKRQLEHIVATGDGTFTTREIGTSFDVITLAACGAQNGDAIVGAIGESQGQFTFSVYRVSSCDNWDLLASGPTDFDWRAPPAPSFGEAGPNVPKTNGVDLLVVPVYDTGTSSLDEAYRFFHYDGYDLREWDVSVASGGNAGATLTFHRTAIHEDRSDYTF